MAEPTIEQILEAIKNYRPPAQIHPVAIRAFELYKGNDWKMTDEIVAALRKDLDAIGTDLKALSDAMCGLVAFMITASEKFGDTNAGEKIGKLLQEQGPKYSPLAEKILQGLQELGIKSKDAFARFMDRDASADRRAPTVDAKAPEGSVPLKAVKPAAAPPRWAKKKSPGKKK
ncbi:MAG: hypothetical protein HYV07_09035 [Deltaproteobacteria bacterium]|nr:hypothetical protein [Deltaproteobacteria bacterium]